MQDGNAEVRIKADGYRESKQLPMNKTNDKNKNKNKNHNFVVNVSVWHQVKASTFRRAITIVEGFFWSHQIILLFKNNFLLTTLRIILNRL